MAAKDYKRRLERLEMAPDPSDRTPFLGVKMIHADELEAFYETEEGANWKRGMEPPRRRRDGSIKKQVFGGLLLVGPKSKPKITT